MASSGASLDEASQAVSLPDLGNSPVKGLQTVVASVEVHNLEKMELGARPKRPRNPSQSPPMSPNKTSGRVKGKSSGDIKKSVDKSSNSNSKDNNHPKKKTKTPSLSRKMNNTGEPSKKSSRA